MATITAPPFNSPPVTDEHVREVAEFPIFVERQEPELPLLKRAHELGRITLRELPFTLLDLAIRLPGHNPVIGLVEIALTAPSALAAAASKDK